MLGKLNSSSTFKPYTCTKVSWMYTIQIMNNQLSLVASDSVSRKQFLCTRTSNPSRKPTLTIWVWAETFAVSSVVLKNCIWICSSGKKTYKNISHQPFLAGSLSLSLSVSLSFSYASPLLGYSSWCNMRTLLYDHVYWVHLVVNFCGMLPFNDWLVQYSE